MHRGTPGHMRLPHRLQGQKVKSQGHGAGAYCGGHLAAQFVSFSSAVVTVQWIRCNWKSAQVVISHLVCDPTVQQPGFDLLRQQWSLLNRFCTEPGHCGACRRKWQLTDTDLCPCGETQTMSHIVESCPLTKLNGGLSQLHSVDEDAVSWLQWFMTCI